MKIGYSNPSFVARKEEGIFPFDLTLGFENEVELTNGEKDLDEVIDNFLHEENFLYAKEDGSLTDGVEINSHPFNWNWFLKQKGLLNFTSYLNREGMEGTRNCGFHVHLNRSFFSGKHIRRFIKLVYQYPDFWSKVSQREDEDNLIEYASFKDVLNYYYNREITLDRAREIAEKSITGHYSALDTKGSCRTLEFRIFQGTTNPNLIRTYLEIVMAMVLYTKETLFDNITISSFIEYVYNNKKLFPKVVNSRILKHECKYHWDTYQRMSRT